MKKLLLVSLKDKNSQAPGKVYAVEEGSIGEFVTKHLTSNVIILIDTVDTYVPSTNENGNK